MSRWITNKKLLFTAYEMKLFKKGDIIRCCAPDCSYRKLRRQHVVYGWENDHLVVGGKSDVRWGQMGLQYIAGWKPQ